MKTDIRVRYCESCHQKAVVAEIHLERKTVWLCEECLEKACRQLKSKRESLEVDRQAS